MSRVGRAALIAVVASLVALGCGSSSSGGATPASNPFVMDPANGTVLPEANFNQPYGQTFKVLSGGTPPYTFRPVSLPPGLSLVPSQGGTQAVLSGSPSVTGTQPVTFQVVDSSNAVFANETYTLKVN